MLPLMPFACPDFDGALINFRIFLKLGPLLAWGPGQVVPYPPPPLGGPVDILQQTCYQRADTRTGSYGLRQLVDDKSVASCRQPCCKLFIKTCYPRSCCKLFQHVTSLQMKNCNKPDFNRLSYYNLIEWNCYSLIN